MCSQKSLPMFGPDGQAEMIRAVADVAERSFFAVAGRCEANRFAELVLPGGRWYAATVRFEEDDCVGAVSCVVADDLAESLFDAFSGREPSEPPPTFEQMNDLIGEFANMVCGAWLTRVADQRIFALMKPAVAIVDHWNPADDEAVLLLSVNDRPLAVGVRVTAVRQAVGCR